MFIWPALFLKSTFIPTHLIQIWCVYSHSLYIFFIYVRLFDLSSNYLPALLIKYFVLFYLFCFRLFFGCQTKLYTCIYILRDILYIYLFVWSLSLFSFPFSATVSSVVVSAVAVLVVAAIVLLLPAFGNHMMTLFLLLRLLTTFSHILFQLNSL